MESQALTQTQQPSTAAALPGTWKLVAGRAITLQPREAGVLRVAHGQLWATYDGPHNGPLNDLGDHVIGVGEQLRLRPGQRVVVEPWNGKGPAYFSWDPLPVAVRRNVPRLARVVQPLSDLRLALTFGAGAAARLVGALAGLAWELVFGGSREALAECARNAQSSARRAHGAMS